MALRELPAADWQYFERFASEFLAVDFPNLRTMASASGDKGRDAELLRVDEVPNTAIQYSVAVDWEDKIRRTIARLSQTMPRTTRIIYCTNQVIGPAADGLTERLRSQNGLTLDIRDRSWFVERELTVPQRQIAAEELSRRIVDPLLAREGIGATATSVLSDEDARIALLHLTLEGYDAQSNRNLTKSCFEALVLSALHGSDSEHARSRDEILDVVRSLVPTESQAQLDALTDGALKRVSVKGGPVKYLSKLDRYHMSYEEQIRRKAQTLEFLERQGALEDEAAVAVGHAALDGYARRMPCASNWDI